MLNNFYITGGEVDNYIRTIREVAQWCLDTNKNMWRMEDLTKEKLIKGLSEENFYVAKIGDDIASGMILQWYDPIFWPQIKKNESGFIHKLCVRRKHSGKNLSRMMIDFAIEECKKRGISCLRLDTSLNNIKLCRLYESMGFLRVGEKKTEVKDYALYEMKIK